MIKSAKGVEINKKLICYTYLHIWFKRVFGLLNYKIWWCVFNKSYSFLYDEGHGQILWRKKYYLNILFHWFLSCYLENA
jgi:hypothetical protein